MGERRAVLVAEDQPLIRLNAVDTVEDAGFEAIEAANATQALTILETTDNVAILYTDIEMPGGIDGLELARMVRERWPSIRIVITSGRVGESDVIMPDGCLFLAKPVVANILLNTLKRVVA